MKPISLNPTGSFQPYGAKTSLCMHMAINSANYPHDVPRKCKLRLLNVDTQFHFTFIYSLSPEIQGIQPILELNKEFGKKTYMSLTN